MSNANIQEKRVRGAQNKRVEFVLLSARGGKWVLEEGNERGAKSCPLGSAVVIFGEGKASSWERCFLSAKVSQLDVIDAITPRPKPHDLDVVRGVFDNV